MSNPIKLHCNNIKYKKFVNIRDNTFFSLINKYQISVIVKIIELFILENKNAILIIKKKLIIIKLILSIVK